MYGALHKVYIFKYRPSSHSDDYTIITTYKNEKAAEKVKRTLFKMLDDMRKNEKDYDADWSPDDAHVSTDGNKVWFEVYTAGYTDDVESVLRKVAVPQEIECYRDYQELIVRVKVPKGLTPEVAMLVLDREEAEAIKWFKQSCGLPKVVDGGDREHQAFEWFYRGDNIYSDGILYIGFEFRVDDCENWKVE
jgi:hypothetical protein